MDIIKVVLEENVSRWIVRGENASGFAMDYADRKDRQAAEEVARQWCHKHGFGTYTVTFLPTRKKADEIHNAK